jgi:hypothetical protein
LFNLARVATQGNTCDGASAFKTVCKIEGQGTGKIPCLVLFLQALAENVMQEAHFFPLHGDG